MTHLNLTANGKPQELILAYLQENVSDVLAEKINNGTPLLKDGKQLLNKKTLDGFMAFANDEARKLAEKHARSACIEDSVVYGWAIHYFEEDSIEGKLFNTDGTEYTPPAKCRKVEGKPAKVEPPKPKQQQASLWDMISTEEKKATTEQADDNEPVDNAEDTVEPTIDEIADALEQAVAEKNGKPMQVPPLYPPFYTQYLELQEHYPEHIVLIRFGDFYEAFDNDAEVLADELNMTLTSRKLTDTERIPVVGFPYHASDIYLAKIRAKHDVVIAENEKITVLAKFIQTNGRTVDPDTGEIMYADVQEPQPDDAPTENATPSFSPSSFDEDTAIYLLKLLDGKMTIA